MLKDESLNKKRKKNHHPRKHIQHKHQKGKRKNNQQFHPIHSYQEQITAS